MVVVTFSGLFPYKYLTETADMKATPSQYHSTPVSLPPSSYFSFKPEMYLPFSTVAKGDKG